ncbi:hypothetical protein GIB67_029743 [Kingdonia uniflora]|uniref:Uncharacterized protein n=1 Tax=Kingdonia uniflora TaxID=39325 RepID=A0A7J7LM58_9MAGN|nr:hypothetical protein GIB67_029743 [Kingdonia uniflora]
MGINRVIGSCSEEHEWELEYCRGNSTKSRVFKLVFNCFVEKIWKERNLRVFEDKANVYNNIEKKKSYLMERQTWQRVTMKSCLFTKGASYLIGKLELLLFLYSSCGSGCSYVAYFASFRACIPFPAEESKRNSKEIRFSQTPTDVPLQINKKANSNKVEASTNQAAEKQMPVYQLPSKILCLAEANTGEVFAQVTLLPESNV